MPKGHKTRVNITLEPAVAEALKEMAAEDGMTVAAWIDARVREYWAGDELPEHHGRGRPGLPKEGLPPA